jgi:uncharacterized protein (TIGR02246 family)
MSESRVADELAIRSLVARYAEAVSAYDETMWAETWASEGQWLVLGRSPTGREEVVKVWNELMSGFEFVVQQATSGHVTIEGDNATGRWQILEFGKMKNGTSMMNIGFYRDECVREDGAWRFARRAFSPLYVGPPDLSGGNLPFPKD